jgi:uncharacterized membrane protein
MVGLGAGLLLATNAFVVSWSQQVRTYALAMLLAIAVTYLFVQALESEGLRWWLVYGIAAGISVYAQFFIAFVLASHVPALVLARRKVAFRRWALASGIGFVIALPALDFALRHDKGQVSWIPDVTYDYLRSVVHDVAGKSWLVLAVALAGAVLLTFAVGRGGRDAWRAGLVVSWLVVPWICAVCISYFKPMLVDRYLIVTAPALALAASYAVSRLGRRAGTAALVVLVAVGLVHVRDWYRSPVTENWRAAVADAEHGSRPDDQILVYPSFMGDPAVYYGGARIDLSQQLTGDGARVIALYQDAPAVQDWFSGAGYRVVDRTNFGSIDVWRVARATTG